MLIQTVPMLLHDARSAPACVAAGFFQMSEESGPNHSFIFIYIYLFISLSLAAIYNHDSPHPHRHLSTCKNIEYFQPENSILFLFFTPSVPWGLFHLMGHLGKDPSKPLH